MQLSKSYLFRYASNSQKSRNGLISDFSVRYFAATNEYDLAVIGGGPGGIIPHHSYQLLK